MIDNETLRHAFGELERHAPAEGEVLAGFRAGVVRRRRRRQVASVVGVGGTACLVALGVMLVAPGRTGQQPTAPAAPTTATKVANPPAPPALPFTVGWLPDGYRLDTWEAGTAESSAQYVGSKDFQTVVVEVGSTRPAVIAGEKNQPTTIAGRLGVIRTVPPDTAETQLIWQLADGRWAMVGGRMPTVPMTALAHVAESLAATPTPMAVPFGLRTVPDGYQVVSWIDGASVLLCRPPVDVRSPVPPSGCITLSLRSGTAPAGTPSKNRDGSLLENPVDREQVVNRVPTRASADGMTVFAQVDGGHWVSAFSWYVGAQLLREVATAVVPS
jgi:hypothetical protein